MGQRREEEREGMRVVGREGWARGSRSGKQEREG